MQTKELKELKDEIIRNSQNIIAQANQSDSIASLKQNTKSHIDTLFQLLEIEHPVSKGYHDPQSESDDDSPNLKFQKQIAKESKHFVVGLENLMVVNRQDLKDLNEMLKNTNSQIDKMGKFKDELNSELFGFVSKI